VLSRPPPKVREVAGAGLDLKDIKGQDSAKRALEIAAAGGHNLLMHGPPGAGKSMLAARLPSILPPLAPAELLEISMIASVAGEIADGALTSQRPFRAPHHSASMPALVGGGLRAKPGEISLAHHGVLFLDEFPEFDPRVLDSLRQPLESGEVSIARANHRVTYPARFMLIAAMNPCRCGRANEPGYVCKRGAATRCVGNAQVPATALEEVARPERAGLTLLREAAETMRLSARGYHRVLRVARSLADLEGTDAVTRMHVAEALSYRALADELQRVG
jgi:magnesium chelatase family protein